MTGHQCVDCRKDPPKTVRKIVEWSGAPRCATHLRATKTRQRKQARARQVERTYDITAEDNHALFLLQGGRCWLCGKATGATKSLAVDHDHETNEVRGRLCGPCNQFIGKLGDDPEAAKRLVAYLTGDTPYRRLKAQQVIAAEGLGVSAVVKISTDECGQLWAEWSDETGRTNWCRTRVRLPDGTWSM